MTPDAQKRAFVLKITGMLDKPEGPLTLHIPDKGGKNKESTLIQTRHRVWDRISVLADEQAVLMTPFTLQGSWLGRSDPSWEPFSSE